MNNSIEPDLIVAREGSAGIIRLNRPKAINALTLEMVRSIDAALNDFEADPAVALVLLEGEGDRGLCAGGDIRSLHESSAAGAGYVYATAFWREEYTVIARIASLSKPYVAWMNGLVMGGGVGMSAHGRHRIVTDTTKLAMPETGIGFFPDVGGTWLLSRAPGELGTYYGLTGTIMGAADAVAAALADVVVPSERWAELRAALTQVAASSTSDDVDATIAKFAAPPAQGIFSAQRETIDRLFAFDSVEEIVAALAADGSDFANATLETLKHKSPTSLKVTLKLLRAARASSSLEDCLTREFRASLGVIASAEFREGVRAAIIDKDRNPQWNPARVEDVTEAIVARYFVARGENDLKI